MENFKLEDGKFGIRLVLTSSWRDQLLQDVKDDDIKEVYLNTSLGWRGKDISFLKKFPSLRAFSIIDFIIEDVSPVHNLHSLRYLDIMTYCKTKLDFTQFSELEQCGLQWRKGADSIFECTTLNKLYLNNYKGKNADNFTRLKNLESLTIANAPIENIEGLRHLNKLKSLALYYLNKLTSLKGIENLVNLEVLDLKTCRKINSLVEIEKLINLKKLLFINMGEIDSIKVLEKLPNLEWVLFYEDTNILDGDLTPLTRLPKLSNLSFKNRRHYSHKREDFPAYKA